MADIDNVTCKGQKKKKSKRKEKKVKATIPSFMQYDFESGCDTCVSRYNHQAMMISWWWWVNIPVCLEFEHRIILRNFDSCPSSVYPTVATHSTSCLTGHLQLYSH